MPLTKEEYTEFRGLWEEIKTTLEDHDKELKKFPEMNTALNAFSGETKTKWERMETRLQELEAIGDRPPRYVPNMLNGSSMVTYDDNGVQIKNYSQQMQTFLKACRYGVGNLTKEEKPLLKMATAADAPAIPNLQIKGLTVGEDTTGGFFAPPEFVPEIIKGYIPFSPIRGMTRIRTTSNRSIQVPRRNGTITAQWVGERTTRTELTGYNLGRLEIPTNEMYGLVLLSEQDIEDAQFDVEGEIRAELSEQFGVAEGKAFVKGNAVIQPQGLLTNTSVPVDISGVEGGVGADVLITSLYALPPVYAPNAQWLMSRKTVGYIRTLKYTGGEQSYIWQPGAGPSASGLDRAPNTIMGLPYTEVPDLPDMAVDSYSIIIGDMSKAYTIVQRAGMTFKRLTERWVENSQIGIYARMRVGGQVVLPEAMRVIQMTT